MTSEQNFCFFLSTHSFSLYPSFTDALSIYAKGGREAQPELYGHKSKEGYSMKEILAYLNPVSLRYYRVQLFIRSYHSDYASLAMKSKSHIEIYTIVLQYYLCTIEDCTAAFKIFIDSFKILTEYPFFCFMR